MLDSTTEKQTVIIILLVFLLISTLGINVLEPVIKYTEAFIAIIIDFMYKFAASLGYSTGEIVNVSSDNIATVAKTSIDITNGAITDAGNLLKGQSGNIDTTLHTSKREASDPRPSSNDDKNQKWCFIEKENGKNKCVKMGANDTCKSGKEFDNQDKCMKS